MAGNIPNEGNAQEDIFTLQVNCRNAEIFRVAEVCVNEIQRRMFVRSLDVKYIMDTQSEQNIWIREGLTKLDMGVMTCGGFMIYFNIISISYASYFSVDDTHSQTAFLEISFTP